MDTLTELFSTLSPGLKTLVSAVVGIAAIFFGGKTGIKSMQAMSDKNITEALIYLVLTLAIGAISIILFVAIWGLANDTGQDLNNEFGMIAPFFIK